MKASDMRRVIDWLEAVKPDAEMSDLQSVIESKYGKIQWDSAAGWGEGQIIAKVNGVRGDSCGLCTAEEALSELALALIKQAQQ